MIAALACSRRQLSSPRAMASAFGHYNGAGSQKRGQFTVTALGRWSSINKTLPAVNSISALHVYDFDNTLFKTPLPNSALWTGPTIGMLSKQDAFINSGWWHDNRILGATGRGIEQEEPRAWEGFWNEKIVDLVRLSMKQPDALCVLLTGRGEQRFADLLRRIAASKQLDFDMLCLKPQVGPDHQKFSSTMKFKQELLTELMETYKHATEIRIYEDRPAHTQGFRDFLEDYNNAQRIKPTRGSIQAEVVQVKDTQTALDPVVEVAQVQRMINEHNEAMLKQPIHLRPNALRIKKTVFFTSYIIEPEDSKKLLELIPIPKKAPSGDATRFHGNNIIIVPRPCPKPILAKVAEKRFTFTTTVGEKAVLRVEADDPREDEYESLFANKIINSNNGNNGNNGKNSGSNKRKHNGDDWNPPRQPAADAASAAARGGGGAGAGGGGRGGRGGRGGQASGRGRGGGKGKGKGKGGFAHYRSLDDVGKNAPSEVNYDDAHPPANAPTGPRGSKGGPGGGGGGGGGNQVNDLQSYY
ncbi:hypothetical protein LLEC1_03084 [Akanthomyces lecanii]|uniref:Swiss Army Knife RNA repair protein HAD domain-containing protein n=1 Tax=Cordyceps confragosa TaxID=2714763 RepID=A0A179I2Y3_CORDF|nr:hypothetical protein LLEC1_03084 [Akanthomyces lecanii]